MTQKYSDTLVTRGIRPRQMVPGKQTLEGCCVADIRVIEVQDRINTTLSVVGVNVGAHMNLQRLKGPQWSNCPLKKGKELTLILLRSFTFQHKRQYAALSTSLLSK